MKLLNMLGCAMLAIGMVALLGSIIVPKVLTSKAQLTQRMTPYDADTAALTGDIGTPVGEPQSMIIDEERAFLKGKGETGARLVDDNYLKVKGIYPLQVKTVDFVAGLVRLGTATVAGIGLLLFLWTRKVLGRAAKANSLALSP